MIGSKRMDGGGGASSIHQEEEAPPPSILRAWSSTHSIQMDGVGASSFSSSSAPSNSIYTVVIPKKSICEADLFGFSAILEFSSRRVLSEGQVGPRGS